MSEIIRIPSLGDLIAGKYRLSKEIGRGGFGVVFQANQEGINRLVAVKMLLPHAMSHEGVVERFRREAHLAGSLSHPNTVKVHDSGLHKSGENVKALPYIVMEYLEGETLHEYLRRHGRLKRKDAFGILLQILGSLSEAHHKGIIHRDLKPENIFICNRHVDERVVKVLDFGIAKAIDGNWDPEAKQRLTRTGFVAGTAEYMAPEQASGEKDVKPALDVYAVGCLAFQMLSGKVPYEGNSPMDIAIKHISDPLPRLPRPYRDGPLEEIVHRAMAKKPHMRFANAREFAEVLRTGDISVASGPMPMLMADEPATIDDGYFEDAETEAMGIDQALIDSVRAGGFDHEDHIPTRVQVEINLPAPQNNLIMDDEPTRHNVASMTTAPVDIGELPPPPGNPAESSQGRNRVMLTVAIIILFLLVAGIGVGIAGFNYLTNGEDPPEGQGSGPTAQGSDPDKTNAPAKDQPDAGNAVAQVDTGSAPAKDPAEDIKFEPALTLATRAELISEPSGISVYQGTTLLGKTPLDLERPDADSQTTIELRPENNRHRRKYVSHEVVIDWAEINDGQKIRHKMRSKRANSQNTADRRPTPKDTTPVRDNNPTPKQDSTPNNGGNNKKPNNGGNKKPNNGGNKKPPALINNGGNKGDNNGGSSPGLWNQ